MGRPASRAISGSSGVYPGAKPAGSLANRPLASWSMPSPAGSMDANPTSPGSTNIPSLSRPCERIPDEAGRLVRRLQREMASLGVFLVENGVEPTKNRAERAWRFAVMWRTGSHGTASIKGNQWVERRLSLRQTCRQLGQSTFGILVDAVTSWFHGRQPDLAWLY